MGAFSLGLSAKLVMRFGIRAPLTRRPAARRRRPAAVRPRPGRRAASSSTCCPAMLLLGFGAGMAFNPVLLAAMSDVEPSESGLASGVVNTSFMMGGALGLAVLASLAAARSHSLAAAGEDAVGGAQRRLPRRLRRRSPVRGHGGGAGRDAAAHPAGAGPGRRARGVPRRRRCRPAADSSRRGWSRDTAVGRVHPTDRRAGRGRSRWPTCPGLPRASTWSTCTTTTAPSSPGCVTCSSRCVTGALGAGAARSELNEMAVRANTWVLGSVCQSYCFALTQHHSMEDAGIFPHLGAEEGGLRAVIDRLGEEHRRDPPAARGRRHGVAGHGAHGR